jgi:hypothetical protein
MKYLLYSALFLLAALATQCRPDEEFVPKEDNTPVDTTEVALWMNGKLVNYEPRFISYRSSKTLSCSLTQSKGQFINILGIIVIIYLNETGEFGNFINFAQYRNIDYGSQDYEVIDPSTAKFTIHAIDTTTKEVRGALYAKFKRKGRPAIVNQDSYLPDTILFEGRFHTKYVVY